MLSEIGGAIGQYQTNMASYDGFFAPKESGWSICLSEDLSDAIDFTNFMNMDITGEYIKGTHDEIMSALTRLEVISEGTDLITIITPDNVYSDFNIVKFQYSRKVEDGIDIIYCDIGFEEVRQVESQYTNTKVPKTQQRGRQQAQETKASDKKENGPQSFANMIFG